ELAGHRWRCDAVAVSPDGKAYLSGGADGSIRVQDRDGKLLRRILLGDLPEKQTQMGIQILAIGVTPDGKTLTGYTPSPSVYHRWTMATAEERIASGGPPRSGGIPPELSDDARLALERLYEDRPPAAPAPKAEPAPKAARPQGFGSGGGLGPIHSGAIVRD